MQAQQLFDTIAEANGDGFFRLNTSLFDEEGTYHPTVVSFAAIEFNSRVLYISGFFADSRSTSGIDSYTANRANLDPLTSLLNKKAIKDFAMDALAKAKHNGSVVTFVMIDLDNFKAINDTYGHMFGDSTLVSVARIMSEAVGSRGVVGRVGGDEFFIVLTGFPDGDPSIRPLLKTIRSNVEWFFKNKIDDIRVTCSVGTASYPFDTDNYDDLFKLADHCLYVGKMLGRNRYIIYTKSILGPVEEILKNSTVVRMENYVSDEEKFAHLRKVVSRCNDPANKNTAADDSLKELLDFYDINSAQYCPANKCKKRYHEASDHDITDKCVYIRLYDTFKEKMTLDTCLSIGTYVNSADTFPALTNYMKEHELCSLLIIPHNRGDEMLGLFVFAARKHFKNWSAFDIKMLKTICALLEYVL